MARRLNLTHDDETRKKIQTSQLVNRLNDHIFGQNGKRIDISATQLKAIEILLRKSLPDLTAIELSGDPENPIQHKVALRPQLTREEWLKAIGAE